MQAACPADHEVAVTPPIAQRAVAGPLPAVVGDRFRTCPTPTWAAAAKGQAISLPAMRHARMMSVLERIAHRFNQAGMPLMALKGAALNLTMFDQPGKRPMDDLDLMIRWCDAQAACALLEEWGALRGRPLVREDFFPRFHYELEYNIGSVCPVKLDLHVRPFRPLRYARTVPRDAFWTDARAVAVGHATILVPSPEDMLIHLAVHAAIHGFSRPMWTDDARRWIDACATQIRWDRLFYHLSRWQLGWPFAQAMFYAEHGHRHLVPPEVRERLVAMRGSWRDRLALRQAPHDAKRPVRHVAVNLICTPSWGFRLKYLWALMTPDEGHLADAGGDGHERSVRLRRLLRWFAPIAGLVRWLRPGAAYVEVRASGIHGLGLFAKRELHAGQTIASVSKRVVEHDNAYVIQRSVQLGTPIRHEITGKLRWLNHSCRPNAVLSSRTLKAVRRIAAGEEITIDYGPEACACRPSTALATSAAGAGATGRAVPC